jgi:hypothetical protein
MVWYSGALEKNCIHACSMGDTVASWRKRKLAHDGDAAGCLGLCTAAAIVDEAWVTLEKKQRSQNELLVTNQAQSRTKPLKITASHLERTLKANELELIGHGERFRVMPIV